MLLSQADDYENIVLYLEIGDIWEAGKRFDELARSMWRLARLESKLLARGFAPDPSVQPILIYFISNQILQIIKSALLIAALNRGSYMLYQSA